MKRCLIEQTETGLTVTVPSTLSRDDVKFHLLFLVFWTFGVPLILFWLTWPAFAGGLSGGQMIVLAMLAAIWSGFTVNQINVLVAVLCGQERLAATSSRLLRQWRWLGFPVTKAYDISQVRNLHAEVQPTNRGEEEVYEPETGGCIVFQCRGEFVTAGKGLCLADAREIAERMRSMHPSVTPGKHLLRT